MTAQLGARLRSLRTWARAHPAWAAETAIALALALAAVSQAGIRSILATTLEAAWLAARSTASLAVMDFGGIAATAGLALARPVLLYAPIVRAAIHVPAHRRAWLAPYAVVGILVLPMTFAAFTTPASWVVLLIASAIGFAVAPRPGWRALAALPTLLALEPMLGHSPLGDRFWTTERLAARCEANDGDIAAGASSDLYATRHYAITPIREGLALFTSERATAWLRIDPDGTVALGEPVDISGNIWGGCVDEADVWLTKRGMLMHLDIGADSESTSVEVIDVPDPPGTPRELDFADAVCGFEHDRILVSEVVQGGIREVDPQTGGQVRTEIGGANIQILRRPDGLVVGIDTARLFVYDPDDRAVVWRGAAGICVMGLDICRADGRVAVTDMAGRIRMFRPDGDGYTLAGSIGLRAPRRIAFSPDCRHLGVTSADDETVFVLASDPLAWTRSYSVGPGLRDLAFVDERTIAVADACTVTTLAVD